MRAGIIYSDQLEQLTTPHEHAAKRGLRNLIRRQALPEEAKVLPARDPRIETACDVLSANAVAKAPPVRPVPITPDHP